MDIYNVSVCKFNNEESHGNIKRLILDEYVQHCCVIDNDTHVATDIFSGEQFYMLQKDNQNRILTSETPKINFTDYFSVDARPIKMENLSRLTQAKTWLAYYRFQLMKTITDKQKVVLCQIVLVNVNLINVTFEKGDENHPFIVFSIKKILAMK